MAIYVDAIEDYGNLVEGQARRYGTQWCHMTADTDEELHTMAEKLGLLRRWAQHMDSLHQFLHHYDLTPNKRRTAIALGAIEVDEDPNQRAWVRQWVAARKSQKP